MYVGTGEFYSQAAAGCGSACGEISGLGGALSLAGSPAIGAIKLVRQHGSGCCGLGDDTAATIGAGAGMAIVIGVMVLAGFLSYQAGKAMAPPGRNKKKWGWIGVPVGMFTGAPGLGVMGWVSNSGR